MRYGQSGIHRITRSVAIGRTGSVEDPTVVVLTPGITTGLFEHAFSPKRWVSSSSRAATCSWTMVGYLCARRGQQRVDVIYRRIDDDFLDPLTFRDNSALACGPHGGLSHGSRGAGQCPGHRADDKALYAYVPTSSATTDEEPILATVKTYLPSVPDGSDLRP
jgi:uncharacterized circularly permuted ATP-grasp superfamily protein